MNIDELIANLSDNITTDSYSDRITGLQSRGIRTEHIEDGVETVTQRLASGAKSFVVYGEPQSGKTEFMIALCCRLLDQGYRTIFIAMNDNTELEQQNLDRFRAAPELTSAPYKSDEIREMTTAQLKIDVPRIIFCRKNGRILLDLIDKCRFMSRRILIDDEADYASPDTNINKDDKDPTTINQRVGSLSRVNQADGVYIGVTATPGRLHLNNTFLNDTNDWVFLEPYPQYRGRSFFFPLGSEERACSNYLLTRLPDQGDSPCHLQDAMLRFMLRTALLNDGHKAASPPELTAYSMLIHTAGKTDDHREDKRIVDSVLEKLIEPRSTAGKKMVKRLVEQAKKANIGSSETEQLQLVRFVLRNIGRAKVLVINNKNDKTNVLQAGKPTALFTFAIGGNIVSRGLTFDRLLTFYFSRNVKGKLQQNTYIQRARMFGNRPYAEYFELCVPDQLFADWADCFQAHELSLRVTKSGSAIQIHGGRNRAADSASIDRRNVTIERSEHSMGAILPFTKDVEKFICTHQSNPLDCLREALDKGILPENAIEKSILSFIDEQITNPETDVRFVLKVQGLDKRFQDVNSYNDPDNENIRRLRGGIIQAMTHKRPEFSDTTHFILPIRNNREQMRFLYKQKLGYTILKNVTLRR